MLEPSLRITELFLSLQGETKTVGVPTVFVRLTGCPLRCQYCDSAYAFQGGTKMDLSTIIQQIKSYTTRYVTVTGGEPLAQPACLTLLTQLCDEHFQVSLETSGALSIADVDPRVHVVLDLKTPGSNEVDKNLWSNLDYLKSHHQIKFVICDRTDYEWTKNILSEHRLCERAEILLSPSYQQLSATDLANWIVEDRLPVRLQIQLHKYLWGDVPGK
ncbi:MAG: 7-carboxy-7-deazaguanine synthase QueE [Legionellales bacterium]|nr:7-carboxy-7-deazaguanine synthase QueE [Legionellales bacterium]